MKVFCQEEDINTDYEEAKDYITINTNEYKKVVHITRDSYERIRYFETTQNVQLIETSNDESGIKVEEKVIRYQLNTTLAEEMLMDDLSLEILPIEIILEASDLDGVHVTYSNIALFNIMDDLGLSAKIFSFKRGDNRDFATNIINRKHYKLNLFEVEFDRVIWGDASKGKKINLKAHWHEKVFERYKDLITQKNQYNSRGYEYGAELTYHYLFEPLATEIRPQVFFKVSKGNENILASENAPVGTYRLVRFGMQFSFDKEIYEKKCKLIFGIAKEKATGMFDISNEEVYSKAECQFGN